jgi:hypothetical protein
VDVEELEVLLLIHLVRVDVIVALMPDYPSNDFNGRDRCVMNHVQQAFLGELADDAGLAADNVPWPLFFLEELFYSQNCSFFKD